MDKSTTNIGTQIPIKIDQSLIYVIDIRNYAK